MRPTELEIARLRSEVTGVEMAIRAIEAFAPAESRDIFRVSGLIMVWRDLELATATAGELVSSSVESIAEKEHQHRFLLLEQLITGANYGPIHPSHSLSFRNWTFEKKKYEEIRYLLREWRDRPK